MSMNLGHTCLFHKGFCMVYFRDTRENAATPPHSAQRKHAFLGEIKEMSKSKKIALIKKIPLGLLHHIYGHRYTRSLMAGDTANVWHDIELKINPDHFSHHVRYLK